MVTDKDGRIEHVNWSSEKDYIKMHGHFCASHLLITFNSPYDESWGKAEKTRIWKKSLKCYPALTSRSINKQQQSKICHTVFVNQMLLSDVVQGKKHVRKNETLFLGPIKVRVQTLNKSKWKFKNVVWSLFSVFANFASIFKISPFLPSCKTFFRCPLNARYEYIRTLGPSSCPHEASSLVLEMN